MQLITEQRWNTEVIFHDLWLDWDGLHFDSDVRYTRTRTYYVFKCNMRVNWCLFVHASLLCQSYVLELNTHHTLYWQRCYVCLCRHWFDSCYSDSTPFWWLRLGLKHWGLDSDQRFWDSTTTLLQKAYMPSLLYACLLAMAYLYMGQTSVLKAQT